MRWRHLRPGELDHERLWLFVTLSLALIGLVWLRSGVPMPECTWKNLTGIPCPGCGATRTVRLLLDGAIRDALLMNPLFFAVAAGVALYDVYAAVVVAFGLPRLRFENLPAWSGGPIRIGAVALIVGNWFWLIFRKT
jgi:hypothetical protein